MSEDITDQLATQVLKLKSQILYGISQFSMAALRLAVA